MSTYPSQSRFVTLVVALLLLLAVGCARADPPGRVARLSYTSGLVSFSAAGEADWVDATTNRPLTTGDRLWADTNSLAEFQMGGAAIQLGASTNLAITRLDDEVAQVELLQGSLKLRVRQLALDQSFEVDTPNLSFSLHEAGDYRIDVDTRGAATVVKVNLGLAVAEGGSDSYTLRTGQAYRFYGTSLAAYEVVPPEPEDGLDRWSRERELRTANSESARYVSNEVVGYEDLDAHGYWRADPVYGNVWWPNQVSAGWTPYHNGHWTWIDPWGWNWVDDAPWGYAVSHYGRWAHLRGSWGWVPGPRHERAVFAPALVVFLGSENFRGSRFGDDGDIGWFPLAPLEVYQPAYQVSHSYFDRVNRSNAQINSVTLINVYQTNINHTNNPAANTPKPDYVNRRVAGAVVAVPVRTFTHSEPVAKTRLGLAKELANRGDLTHAPLMAPTPQSRNGGAPEARGRPPSFERRILVRPAFAAPASPLAPQRVPMSEQPTNPIHGLQRPQIEAGRHTEPSRNPNTLPMVQAPVPAATKIAPVMVETPRAWVKPVPDATEMYRKPATPIPARNVEDENIKAVRASRAREAAARAAAGQEAVDRTNKARAIAPQAQAAAKAEEQRAHAAQAVVNKGVAQPNAPQAHPSEARVIRKQMLEVR